MLLALVASHDAGGEEKLLGVINERANSEFGCAAARMAE